MTVGYPFCQKTACHIKSVDIGIIHLSLLETLWTLWPRKV